MGRFLFEQIILKACKIDKNIIKYKNFSQTNESREQSPTSSFIQVENAFNKIYRLVGVYKEPQLKVHPILNQIFSSELIFESNRLPMIVPPMPWYMPTQGGYFLSRSNLLRLKSDLVEQRLLVESSHPSNMYPIFDSLNTLSACPWKINTQILDILIDIFVKDGNKELDVPEHVETKGPKISKMLNNAVYNKKDYKEFLRKRESEQKICSEMHSLWCSELYRLSIANMYRNKVIWFPHSLDFRGRVYPIPPHFNHLGSDIARSIILLAEGRKLGPNGLDMLKIHLINLTGTMKKFSITERLEYANSILDDIIDSAENPFTGKSWWKRSGK